MERTALAEKLREISGVLLSPALDYLAVKNACESLSSFFIEVSGIDLDNNENQQPVFTSSGTAISPYAAASCVTDMMRTRNFLQGIREAISTRIKTNPGKPVVVLYAGTGPFATLFIPLTTIYTPDEIQFILMDINPVSIRSLQQIISTLGLQSYVKEMIEADAATYIIPDDLQPDILLSETMKAGLQKEPQVSIISHLLPQCNRQPFLIPERITVEACLAGNTAENPDAIQHLSTLLEFDAETAMRIKRNPEIIPVLSDGIVIKLTERPATHLSRLVLQTTIKVFGDYELVLNKSGLTTLVLLLNITAIKKFPSQLLFQYCMNSNPGFTVKEL